MLPPHTARTEQAGDTFLKPRARHSWAIHKGVGSWPYFPPTASLYGLKLFSLSPLPQQTQFSRSWGVFWGAAYESPAHSPTTQLTRYFPQCSPTLATCEKHIWAFSKYWTLPTRAEFLEVFLKQMYAGKSPWGILRCITIRNHQCH